MTAVRFRPAWRNYWYLWPLFFLGVPWLYALYRRYDLLLEVTEDEVHLERGVFSRSATEIRLRDIKSVEVFQTLMQRLLGVGRIRLATAGTEGWEIEAEGLLDPEGIRELIQRRGGGR